MSVWETVRGHIWNDDAPKADAPPPGGGVSGASITGGVLLPGGVVRRTLPSGTTELTSVALSDEAVAAAYTEIAAHVFAPDSAYSRTRRAVENLRDVIPDEALRFTAALKASSIDAAMVLRDMSLHEQALAHERAVFGDAVKTQDDAAVRLRGEIEEIDRHIEALRTQIAEAGSKRERAVADADDITGKVARARATFDAACERVRKQLVDDRARLEGAK